MSGRQKGRLLDDRGLNGSASHAVSAGGRLAERAKAAAYALSQERTSAATENAQEVLADCAEALEAEAADQG